MLKTVKNAHSILADEEFTLFSYERKKELVADAKEIYKFCDKFNIYEKEYEQKKYYIIVDRPMKKIIMLRDDRGLIEEVPSIIEKQLFSIIHDVFELKSPYSLKCFKDRFYVLPTTDARESKEILRRAENYPNLFLSDKWIELKIWNMTFIKSVYFAETKSKVAGIVVPYFTYPGVITDAINFFYNEI